MSIEILSEDENDLNDPPTDTIFDLADCCRTCLRHECSLTPTNSSDSDSIKFCDKLAACVSGLKWAKEGAESFICGICIEKLRIAYDFQTICLQSDTTLQLQEEASEKGSSRSVTPDPTTTTDLAECDKTIENIILNVKAEETQIQLLSECAPDTSAAAQLKTMRTSDNPCKDGCQVYGKELCEDIQRHTGKQCFQCSVCLKEFMMIAELTEHMQVHTEEKLYACNFCENMYINKVDLLVHMFSHTCSYCDKKYPTKYLLDTHMKTHNNVSNSWRCKICNKSYTTSRCFSQHVKTHTVKYSCKICDKKFAYRSSVVAHVNNHMGNKLWRCQTCRKSYARSSTLKRHMMIHNGKNHSC